MNNFANSKLVKWLTSNDPEDNLASWLRKKRIKALEERESLIRQTAYKLWEQDGKPDDRSEYYWLEAIKKLNSETTFGLLLSKLFHLGYAIEKPLEKGLAFLKSLAVLEILGILGNITIVIAVIGFIATEKQRRDAEVYQAWQVITAAYEQTGSGGRTKALEFLNSEQKRFPWLWLKWERESLSGLAAPKAYLAEIKLQEADLRFANLQETNLEEANLQQAFLYEANLQQADLLGANLQQAFLYEANLQEAFLYEANLQQADLLGANLQQAFLSDANLQQAFLSGANCQQTNLEGANLQQADLEGANLQQAFLSGANLQQADLEGANLQQAFLSGANFQQTYIDQAKNLTNRQIKSTCFWEEAIYKGKWNSEKQIYIAIEPDNSEFIEDLKKDSSSDSEITIDCKFWEKK